MLKRLGRIFGRLRGHNGKSAPEAAVANGQRETATTVAVPWRSSASWDEYDLRVYPRRGADRFQFYVEVGNLISVRAENQLPEPRLRLRVFGRETGQEVLAQGSSDDRGIVELFVVVRVGGMHSVEVGFGPPKSERPQSYRLSIDAPSGIRPADDVRGRRAEFVDVPVGHPYREAIAAMAGAEVMGGYGEWWEFAPDEPVTRVQLAEMVRDSLGSEGSGAVPVLLADLAAQERLKGVFRVLPRDRDRPDTQVVAIARAQAVSLVVGALERYRPGVLVRPPRGYACTVASGHHRFHARIAEYNGLLRGLVGFGPQWDPRVAVSRGEVAEMLWATMRLAGTAVEESAQTRAGPSAGPADDEGEPDLAALGVYTPEYQLGTEEEIDRLMAESGLVDGSLPPNGAGVPIRPVSIDPAGIRQSVEQTRDRLRAKTLDPPEPAQENGASADH
jgi:hypothetical protein